MSQRKDRIRSRTCSRDTHNTPGEFLERVRRLSPIALDPCSNATSIVGAAVEYRFDRGQDGLVLPWRVVAPGLVYVNPPYGRKTMPRWVDRMIRAALEGLEVLALIPHAAPKWAHRLLASVDATSTLKQRLKFLGNEGKANFDSLVAYWGPQRRKFRRIFGGAYGTYLGGPRRECKNGFPSHFCTPAECAPDVGRPRLELGPADVLTLRKAGLSIPEIAAQLDCSRRTVLNRLAESRPLERGRRVRGAKMVRRAIFAPPRGRR